MRVKYRALACLGCSCSLLLLTTTVVFASLFGWTNSLREEVDCAKIKDRLVWVPLFAQPSNYDFIRTYEDGVFIEEYVGPKHKCEKYWQRSTQRRRLQDDDSAVIGAAGGAAGGAECVEYERYNDYMRLQCLCAADYGAHSSACSALSSFRMTQRLAGAGLER